MKINLLLILLLGFSITGYAQNLDVGFGFGSGKSYIFESQDKNVDINYSAPFSNYLFLNYIPENSFFNLKLNFQYINSAIDGTSWKTNEAIKGEVSSLNTSLLMEHLPNNQIWNFGFNFGFGYTIENFISDLESREQSEFRRYMNTSASAMLSVNVSERIFVQLSPTLIWIDPVNSFRSSEKWNIAGEDLNLLVQLGFAYRLK